MNENIGQTIRKFRIEKGLSQYELAEMLGKTRSLIAYWEMGRVKISLENLVKLADVLDVSLYELATGEKKHRQLITWYRGDEEALTELLVERKIIKKDYELSFEECERIMDFLKRNIDLLLDAKEKK